MQNLEEKYSSRWVFAMFWLIGLALTLFSSAAQSAQIQLSNDKLCAFKLEGAILAGDFDRFSLLISRNKLDDLDERTFSACLKSNGGSYGEALKISELFYEKGISTVIEPGAQCFSACAIIFMAGSTPGRIVPLRKLSARGVLGFHAPFVTMSDQAYSKEQVESVAQAMREAVLALVRLSSKQMRLGGEFIKKSLIEKILEKGPRDVFFVKTISEAARWDILIYDAAEHYQIRTATVLGAKNICKNFHSANMDEPVPLNKNLSIKIENYSSRFSKSDFRILVLGENGVDTVCEIYPKEDKLGRVNFHGCSFDYWSSKSFGDCREYKTAAIFGRYIPDFFALDPETLLKSFAK